MVHSLKDVIFWVNIELHLQRTYKNTSLITANGVSIIAKLYKCQLMHDYESMSPTIPSGDVTDALPPQYFNVCAFHIQTTEKRNVK